MIPLIDLYIASDSFYLSIVNQDSVHLLFPSKQDKTMKVIRYDQSDHRLVFKCHCGNFAIISLTQFLLIRNNDFLIIIYIIKASI